MTPTKPTKRMPKKPVKKSKSWKTFGEIGAFLAVFLVISFSSYLGTWLGQKPPDTSHIEAAAKYGYLCARFDGRLTVLRDGGVNCEDMATSTFMRPYSADFI